MSIARFRRLSPLRLVLAGIAAALGCAIALAGALPAHATVALEQRLELRMPAPGHSVEWSLSSPGTPDERHVILSVPSAVGAGLTGEQGLLFTVKDDRGAIIADGVTAAQLGNRTFDLGQARAGQDITLTGSAHLPAAADNSYRTATAEVVFRFSSETNRPGGLLAATGLDSIKAFALALSLIALALVLLFWTRRRRLRFVIAPLAAAVCSLALLVGSADSWATFTNRAALDATVHGQFGIGLRDRTGVVRQTTDKTVSYRFADASALVPGNTAVMTLAVFNNSVGVPGRIGLRITGDGETASYLRYSVSMDADGDRTVLLGDPDAPEAGAPAPADGIAADLGVVAPAGARLNDGDRWPASADPSLRTLTVYVHLADDPALRSLSSGTATVSLDLNGSTL